MLLAVALAQVAAMTSAETESKFEKMSDMLQTRSCVSQADPKKFVECFDDVRNDMRNGYDRVAGKEIQKSDVHLMNKEIEDAARQMRGAPFGDSVREELLSRDDFPMFWCMK